MNTQSLNTIKIEEVKFKQFLEEEVVAILEKEITSLLENNDSIKMKNKDVYYIKGLNSLIPDLNKFQWSTCTTFLPFGEETKFKNEFSNFSGQLITESQLDYLTANCQTVITPLKDKWVSFIENNRYQSYFLNSSYGYSDHICFNCSDRYCSINIPIVELENKSLVLNLISYDLVPSGLTKESKRILRVLIDLYQAKEQYIVFKKEKIVINKDIKQIATIVMNKDKSLMSSILTKKLLKCDQKRADIEPYSEKMLEDVNGGYWDLWHYIDNNKEGVEIHLSPALVARNPILDVKQDGIIGIDFGTKSTIVVCQDGDSVTAPMRIGTGHFNKEVRATHYENPTVMEFMNLENFLKAYQEKAGRPETSFCDLVVSHNAFNSLTDSKQSENYYAYFTDLKQWAGSKNRLLKLKDKQGNERVLPSYLEIEDGAFDPVEIYAYYIGLYINNMHNGIYLNYSLSFPVTYEKEIRKKILNSFAKGLKKSLPESLLNDEEVMKKFRVEQGASEPAAYAICALTEFGFDPEDDEEIFYGIFDFGGGTTDFDFGIWRSADEITESRYDYVINHFGAGGDKYLGGENLLELLAFEVFKDNQQTLRKEAISFRKPEECKKFAGSETLLSDSAEAKLNMTLLMEKLCPLWEKHEGYEKEFSNGEIGVNLFDKAGNLKMNIKLTVCQEKLETILYNRIEKGVRNFFESLKLTFDNTNASKRDHIIIFLAGNSSKSSYVKEIFEKYIAEMTKELKAFNNEKVDKDYFIIYPPLGSPEAIALQKENGVDIDENDITRPTGKTGVAFGLVEGRKGGSIKVITEQKIDAEIKFGSYIGRNRKKRFKTVMDRNIQYHKWVQFITADVEDFEFYHTNLPEATTNKLPITEATKKLGRIDKVYDNAYIYIRAVAPSVIEYGVSTEEKVKNNEMLSDIYQVKL